MANPDVTPTLPGVRSLADDLRARTDSELAALLTGRPDLARPTPGDLTSVAARSTTRASTLRAVDALDRAGLDVLTVVAVLADNCEVPVVASGLGLTEADHALVAAQLDRLWTLALIWGSDTRQVSRTVLDVLGPGLAGLGPSRAQLGLPSDPEPPDLPVGARTVLDSMTWGPPVALIDPGTKVYAVGQWLARHSLCALTETTLTLPRETALALREGRVLREVALTPPAPSPDRSWEAEAVDRTAGGAASELLALLDEILARWSTDPPRVLKGGGLAARDLTGLARALDTPSATIALILEVAQAGGLLAADGEEEPHWAPTQDYDGWLDQPGGTRWVRLAQAWWETTRDPALVGTHRDGRLVAALSPAAGRPGVRALRRDVMHVLADQPVGTALTAADVVEHLRWRRPRRIPDDVEAAVGALLAEAATLGLVALGALSSAGRGLVEAADPDGPTDAAELARTIDTHLPPPVNHVLLQADLTAVVPGPTSGSLTHFLRLAADVESRGGASVHRFTEESIRRCLDAGWSVEEILAALADASSTAVPQPLDYLVRDAARRHGRLRVTGARAVLRADDPAALEAILADRAVSALQLRRIAPTVALSPARPEVVLGMLSDAGHGAVAESATGAIALRENRVRRSPNAPTARASVQAVDQRTAYAMVDELRMAEEAGARTRRLGAPTLVPTGDPTMSMVVLREAAADGRPVWVGYSDGVGAVRRFLFYPESVEHGRVHGFADGSPRTLSIHRITGVAPQ